MTAITAKPGDRLALRAHRAGEAGRDAEVVEVLGPDGRPPWRVRWTSDGHESVLYSTADVSELRAFSR